MADQLGTAAGFEAACWDGIRRCGQLPSNYVPGVFIGMIGRVGAVEAAHQLVIQGDVQSGFQRLINEGHPELTIEWMICDPRWDQLFTDDHRAAARWRLAQAGVTVR